MSEGALISIVLGTYFIVAFFLTVAYKSGLEKFLEKLGYEAQGALPPMIALWPASIVFIILAAILNAAYKAFDFSTTFLANMLKSK